MLRYRKKPRTIHTLTKAEQPIIMVQKKVDPRVRGLIEYGVRKNHRSMFILVGDHGKDQVENLHKILSKARVKARPSVLWCYKKELGFSTHRKKRMKEIKKNQARGLHDPEVDDPFDLFISSTNIRWYTLLYYSLIFLLIYLLYSFDRTYYKESDRILGQTFGMCVLQDFEALTPNLLARTIETVEGGGLVVLLLKTVKSLKQLYTMTMDVHSRFRTEAHHEIVPRFNERFILSLSECHGCLVLDDELNILPISTAVKHMPTSEGLSGLSHEEGDVDASGYSDDPELIELKASLADTPNAGNLVALAKTIDQGKAIVTFLNAISEKTLKSTVSLTSGRGRGKSAAIGLCLAGAISYGYSNVFVTAPSPENLKTVFEFVISGLKALKYVEHLDFEVLQENIGDAGKVVVRVNIFREHRQTIQYILPSDHLKLAQAELVAIDEAAAIPLPTIKKLMGSYLVFLSSTINGYEGTGRSLSLKLIQQLRSQQGASMAAAAQSAGNALSGPKQRKADSAGRHEDRWKVAAEAAANYSSGGSGSGARVLTEITLDTPIRYKIGDPIEKWMNNLLCLDVAANSTRIVSSMPAPKDCELYMVNRDALFSYHALSESMLQRIWALYTSAHYKNTPNDLQMLSDAPAHRLFVLLGPQALQKAASGSTSLPDILCVVQVAFEGFISAKSVQSEIAKGNKASGDMIPWSIAQQFNDNEFSSLSGARVVRIATHPDVQKMGYGSRAIDLLYSYFQGDISMDNITTPGVFGGEGYDNDNDMQDGDEGEKDKNELVNESIAPRTKLPPLLVNIAERPAERLHWLGVSYGITTQLQNFWCRKGFKLCYLRQTPNELTGEYSAIVLKELNCTDLPDGPVPGWLDAYLYDYRKRLISLMSYAFRTLDSTLAIMLIDPERQLTATTESITGGGEETTEAKFDKMIYNAQALTANELISIHLSHHDMKRLEMYSRNMVDHHMILDIVPVLARLAFLGRIKGLRLSQLQVVILLATGLQNRDIDSISSELDLPVSQCLAFFNKTIRKISSILRELVEANIEKKEMIGKDVITKFERKVTKMESFESTLTTEHADDIQKYNKDKMKSEIVKTKDFNKHVVKADDDALIDAFNKGVSKQKAIPHSISIPVSTSASTEESDDKNKRKHEEKKKNKRKKHKHDHK